jgi:hypothetical protein
MAREPTKRDLATVRKAGTKAELLRWWKLAQQTPKGKGGRREARGDDPMLAGLELFCEVAKRERGMNRTAALKWIVLEGLINGASVNAVTARLRRKLKNKKVRQRLRRRLATLKARGVDPSRLSLTAPQI